METKKKTSNNKSSKNTKELATLNRKLKAKRPKPFLANNSRVNLLNKTSLELDLYMKDYPKLISKEECLGFKTLYRRFLKTKNQKIDWKDVKKPSEEYLTNYNSLKSFEEKDKAILNKVAVLKLNGGLGTTLGCKGPKSLLDVKSGHCFLDLVIKELKSTNKKLKTDIPLILMNSFNTDSETKKFLTKYETIKFLNQSSYPKISCGNLLPVDPGLGKEALYPPGHGDLLQSLVNSDLLDELISEGKDYLFISNIDNLGATLDLDILKYFNDEKLDFCMELTEKTRNDIKGGIIIEHKKKLKLLEIAQVPKEHLKDFLSTRNFKIFNTNNVWLNLKALKKLKIEDIKLDIIQNRKVLSTGEKVLQLETAIGSALSLFKNTAGLIVNRDRFRPVKNFSDLFLIRSNLFEEKNGKMKINKKRVEKKLPHVKLIGDNFKNVEDFEETFKGLPDILELEHLTIYGDVSFGKGITIRGTVIIIAGDGRCIRIPEGAYLEDNIIYGNLPIIDF